MKSKRLPAAGRDAHGKADGFFLTVSNKFKGSCRSPSVSGEVVVNRRKIFCIEELRCPAAIEDAHEVICPARMGRWVVVKASL